MRLVASGHSIGHQAVHDRAVRGDFGTKGWPSQVRVTCRDVIVLHLTPADSAIKPKITSPPVAAFKLIIVSELDLQSVGPNYAPPIAAVPKTR